MPVQEVHVPDLGGVDEVEVIEVLVGPGDSVGVDDPLITLESDKASMELPSPAAGTVKELKLQLGDKVSGGSLVLLLDVAVVGRPEDATPQPEVGGTADEQTGIASPDDPASGPLQPDVIAASETGNPDVHSAMPAAGPSARQLAREQSVDLASVEPTGPKGRISKEDVLDHVGDSSAKAAASTRPAPTQQQETEIPRLPVVDFSIFGPVEELALSRIKRVSGPHLHRVWLNVPMVTHHDEADITEMEAFRQAAKPEAEVVGVRLTPLAFIMKSVVISLRAHPEVNASLSADKKSLILKKYYHLGIAVDTPNGLVVPVIRDVDKKGLFAISRELAEVSERARNGKLKPGDMEGACFSISSLGGIGGTAFTPIVNAPEIAILGVTRSVMKPVWTGDEFVPRLMLPLDLTYDHRVIDGALAARFMVHLCRTLGDTRRLLL